MGKITDFLKKIGLLKMGTTTYSGKDHKIVDDFHSVKEDDKKTEEDNENK